MNATQALAPTACTTIEEVGSTGVGALTLGFLALAVSTVVMVAKAASADAERRKYYFCNTFICGVATFSYFAMLSGQGWTAIAGCRQFFYARYVDWMITTSLIILDLGLVAGQDFVTIAAVVGADSKFRMHAPTLEFHMLNIVTDAGCVFRFLLISATRILLTVVV